MRRPVPHPYLVIALFALAACTDRNPAGSPRAPDPAPQSAMALLTCTVSVRDETVACLPPDAALPSGVSGAVIGGQGENVRLASSGVSYDGTSTFRMDVTLENLTAQALGTADGVTPSAEGVRVFFSNAPVATVGKGDVEVANADGEAFFTAAAQKFFRYTGILAPGDTTAPREWRFSVPAAVTSFTFGVYVASPVRAETGWLSISPLAPSLLRGDSLQLSAFVRSLSGATLGGQAVAWSTSNAAVATVDGQGLVRSVGVGTATLTATSGGRTGSVDVHVYADTANPLSTIVGFRMLRSTLTADGVDSVTFEVKVRGAGAGVPPAMIVRLRSLNGFGLMGCSGPLNFTAPDEGFYRCSTTLHAGALGGAWMVDSVTSGPSYARRGIGYAGLVAAGVPAQLYVNSPEADVTAPTLHAFQLSPTTIRAGVDVLEAYIAVGDEQSEVTRVGVIFSSPGNPRYGCNQTPYLGGTTCRMSFAPWLNGGTWTADSVWAQDANGNRLVMTPAQLQAAGFQPQFTMTSTNPDTVPPVITAFAFTPDSVAGNGADSVAVTLTAEEPADQSGVWFLDMEFEKASDTTQRRRCLVNGTGRVLTRTLTCRQAFGAGDAGPWRVRYVRAIDLMSLSRVLFTADLQAAGYPTELVVTAP